ncbi:MAG: hypothetical protein JW888_02190 [Pirellulales bacterium]|nr:hypothetical protein [Pirellulales bacterium]
MSIRCFDLTRVLAVCATLTMLAGAGAHRTLAQEGTQNPDDIAKSIKAQFERRDPTVELLQKAKPNTPAERIRMATIMANLDRPDLAKRYLKEVIEANLDEAQRIALGERLGPIVFTRLASQSELAPEAAQVADAVLSALKRHREAPDQLAKAVKQLSSRDQDSRDRAMVAIRKAGSAAVDPLVAVLADPARSGEHAGARRALASLGSDATGPLLAYFESSDPELVVQVIDVLTATRSRDSLLYLLAPYASRDSEPVVQRAAEDALRRLVGPLPSLTEAAGVLAHRAEQYFAGQITMPRNTRGKVTVWHWDPETRRAVAKNYPPKVAQTLLAARLASQALAISPSDPDIRRLYLLTTLEGASYEAGLDHPIAVEPGTPVSRAAEFGAEALLAVLNQAISNGHWPAATAAAQLLGQTATAETALAVGAAPSPLVRALRASDRRTRVAAVEAVIQLKPTKPFPGSSYLGESMAFLATSTGARRALVTARTTVEARRVGGYLSRLGYEVETAVSGREMMKKLTGSADYELVFVDARIDQPPVDFLLQQLRHDGRTAWLPVGVLAAEGFYERAEKAARDDSLALSLVRPHDEQTVRWYVERLQKLAGQAMVSSELRKQQAAWTLGQLAQLAKTSRGAFDLGRVQQAVLDAARSRQLASDAIGVLARLGTAESQKTLVDLASNRDQSVELRKAALAALTDNVERNGALLTSGQILQQYDRYNQSAAADRPTQEILGLILDCLEAKSKGSRR